MSPKLKHELLFSLCMLLFLLYLSQEQEVLLSVLLSDWEVMGLKPTIGISRILFIIQERYVNEYPCPKILVIYSISKKITL